MRNSEKSFGTRFIQPFTTLRDFVHVRRDHNRLAGVASSEQLADLRATRASCRNVLLLWGTMLLLGGGGGFGMSRYWPKEKALEEEYTQGFMPIMKHSRDPKIDTPPGVCGKKSRAIEFVDLYVALGFDEAEAMRLLDGICDLPSGNKLLVENIYMWAAALGKFEEFTPSDSAIQSHIIRLRQFFAQKGRAYLYKRIIKNCGQEEVCYMQPQPKLELGTFIIDRLKKIYISDEGDPDAARQKSKWQWMLDHNMPYFESATNTFFLPYNTVESSGDIQRLSASFLEQTYILLALTDAYWKINMAANQGLVAGYSPIEVFHILEHRIPVAVQRFIMQCNSAPLEDTSDQSVANAVMASVQSGVDIPLTQKQLHKFTYVVVCLLADKPEFLSLQGALLAIRENPQNYFKLAPEESPK